MKNIYQDEKIIHISVYNNVDSSGLYKLLHEQENPERVKRINASGEHST